MRRLCALALVFGSACSFAFVKEPNDAMLTKKAPLTCTTSRSLPVVDLVIGTAIGAMVFAATYAAVERFNDECASGQCYRPWGPALLGSFLMGSPWWISSASAFLTPTNVARPPGVKLRECTPKLSPS